MLKTIKQKSRLLEEMEDQYFQMANDIHVEAEKLNVRIDKYILYKDFYKKRFGQSDSRSIMNIRNLSMQIMQSCERMTALQRIAKLANKIKC